MSTEERIYQDATKSTDNRKLVHGSIYGSGYIDGALSERNKTIEQMEIILTRILSTNSHLPEVLKNLESLKV